MANMVAVPSAAAILRPWTGPPQKDSPRFTSRLSMVHNQACQRAKMAESEEAAWQNHLDKLRQAHAKAAMFHPEMSTRQQLSPRLNPFANRLPTISPAASRAGTPVATLRPAPGYIGPVPPPSPSNVAPVPPIRGPVASPRSRTPRVKAKPSTPRSSPRAEEPQSAEPPPVPPKAPARQTSEILAEKLYNKEKREYVMHHPGDLEAEVSHAPKASDKILKKEVHTLADHVANKYKLLQKAFLDFDEDSSGKLSPFELEQVVKHFNLNIPHEHVMQIALQVADKDGDGQIDYNEFCEFIKEKDVFDPEIFLKGRTDGVIGEFGNNHKGRAQYSRDFRAEDPDKVFVGNHIERTEMELQKQRSRQKMGQKK